MSRIKAILRKIPDILFLVLAVVAGAVVLAVTIYWFVTVEGKDDRLPVALANLAAIVGGASLIGAIYEISRGQGSLSELPAWASKLLLVGVVGLSGVGIVLPVGRMLTTEDQEYWLLTVLINVAFYGAAGAFSLAMGILMVMFRRLNVSSTSTVRASV